MISIELVHIPDILEYMMHIIFISERKKKNRIMVVLHQTMNLYANQNQLCQNL
jgi:hypothetical protein